MRLGHRGSNHPVRALPNADIGGALNLPVQITRQNHNLAVSAESLVATDLEITHSELHDHTVEGLRHRTLPLWTLQFYPDCTANTLDEIPACAPFWRAVSSP